jgi:hypothetical protein
VYPAGTPVQLAFGKAGYFGQVAFPTVDVVGGGAIFGDASKRSELPPEASAATTDEIVPIFVAVSDSIATKWRTDAFDTKTRIEPIMAKLLILTPSVM